MASLWGPHSHSLVLAQYYRNTTLVSLVDNSALLNTAVLHSFLRALLNRQIFSGNQVRRFTDRQHPTLSGPLDLHAQACLFTLYAIP